MVFLSMLCINLISHPLTNQFVRPSFCTYTCLFISFAVFMYGLLSVPAACCLYVRLTVCLPPLYFCELLCLSLCLLICLSIFDAFIYPTHLFVRRAIQVCVPNCWNSQWTVVQLGWNHAGNLRRSINQHTAGAVSGRGLMTTLDIRSEQRVWIYSTCTVDDLSINYLINEITVWILQ